MELSLQLQGIRHAWLSPSRWTEAIFFALCMYQLGIHDHASVSDNLHFELVI